MQQGSLEKKIVVCLDRAGIKHACAGYKYLVLCVQIVLESRNRVFKVRDIYEIAAERAGIQWQTIERAIRISMKRAANEMTKKLTNKELIARIVDQLID